MQEGEELWAEVDKYFVPATALDVQTSRAKAALPPLPPSQDPEEGRTSDLFVVPSRGPSVYQQWREEDLTLWMNAPGKDMAGMRVTTECTAPQPSSGAATPTPVTAATPPPVPVTPEELQVDSSLGFQGWGEEGKDFLPMRIDTADDIDMATLLREGTAHHKDSEDGAATGAGSPTAASSSQPRHGVALSMSRSVADTPKSTKPLSEFLLPNAQEAVDGTGLTQSQRFLLEWVRSAGICANTSFRAASPLDGALLAAVNTVNLSFTGPKDFSDVLRERHSRAILAFRGSQIVGLIHYLFFWFQSK